LGNIPQQNLNNGPPKGLERENFFQVRAPFQKRETPRVIPSGGFPPKGEKFWGGKPLKKKKLREIIPTSRRGELKRENLSKAPLSKGGTL